MQRTNLNDTRPGYLAFRVPVDGDDPASLHATWCHRHCERCDPTNKSNCVPNARVDGARVIYIAEAPTPRAKPLPPGYEP